jgi:uncharacterized membrane protein YgcG
MPAPPYPCQRPTCGHAAADSNMFIHTQASPHVCNVRDCGCEAFVYDPSQPASEFEGGGGSGGGGGATGGW